MISEAFFGAKVPLTKDVVPIVVNSRGAPITVDWSIYIRAALVGDTLIGKREYARLAFDGVARPDG